MTSFASLRIIPELLERFNGGKFYNFVFVSSSI